MFQFLVWVWKMVVRPGKSAHHRLPIPRKSHNTSHPPNFIYPKTHPQTSPKSILKMKTLTKIFTKTKIALISPVSLSQTQKIAYSIIRKAISKGTLYSNPLAANFIEIPNKLFIELYETRAIIKTSTQQIEVSFPISFFAKIDNQFLHKNNFNKEIIRKKYDIEIEKSLTEINSLL